MNKFTAFMKKWSFPIAIIPWPSIMSIVVDGLKIKWTLTLFTIQASLLVIQLVGLWFVVLSCIDQYRDYKRNKKDFEDQYGPLP